MGDPEARAWSLLADLFEQGAAAPNLERVEALRPHLSASGDAHTIFSLEVFPYGGVFLTPEGLLGGEEAEACAALLSEAGAQRTGEHGDHVVALLRGLAGTSDRGPLRLHLLRWMPVLRQALLDVPGAELYAAGAQLVLDLGGRQADDWSLPAQVELLTLPETGLREIAAWMATPCYLGAWLSRAVIRRIGREHGLPTGFGTRRDLVENLLEAAADQGVFREVVGSLDQWLAGWERGLVFDGAMVWARRAREGRLVLGELGLMAGPTGGQVMQLDTF